MIYIFDEYASRGLVKTLISKLNDDDVVDDLQRYFANIYDIYDLGSSLLDAFKTNPLVKLPTELADSLYKTL